MLREQKLDIFEDLYIEATRYAKEIHKKNQELNPKFYELKDKKEKKKLMKQDTIEVGKRKDLSDVERKNMGGERKQNQPGKDHKEILREDEKFGKVLNEQEKKKKLKNEETKDKEKEKKISREQKLNKYKNKLLLNQRLNAAYATH